MNFELYQLTLGVAVLMLVAEIFTGALLFLGFAIGLAGLALVHGLTGVFSWGRDLALVAAVSALAFIGLRRVFRRRGDSTAADEDVNRY